MKNAWWICDSTKSILVVTKRATYFFHQIIPILDYNHKSSLHSAPKFLSPYFWFEPEGLHNVLRATKWCLVPIWKPRCRSDSKKRYRTLKLAMTCFIIDGPPTKKGSRRLLFNVYLLLSLLSLLFPKSWRKNNIYKSMNFFNWISNFVSYRFVEVDGFQNFSFQVKKKLRKSLPGTIECTKMVHL